MGVRGSVRGGVRGYMLIEHEPGVERRQVATSGDVERSAEHSQQEEG